MKFRHVKFFLAVTVLAVAVAMLCGCIDMDEIMVDLGFADEVDNMNNRVTVVVRDTDGVSLKDGTEPVQEVKRGYQFRVQFRVEPGYVYLSNSVGGEVVYNADTNYYVLTVRKVSAAMTIDINVVDRDEVYEINVDKTLPGAKVNFAKGSSAVMLEPKECTLTAEYPSDYIFNGWSLGASLTDGGTLISTDTTLKYTPEELQYKTNIYANFSSAKYYQLVYHANGGVINKASNKSTLEHYTVTGQYSDMFPLQNTFNENHSDITFVREGYIPIGYSSIPIDNFVNYNCQADSGGVCDQCPCVNHIPGFVNMGGLCYVSPNEGMVNLNVVWAKVTPAEYFTYETGYVTALTFGGKTTVQGAVITKYTGNDKVIVIPEELGGEPVISVENNAFRKSIIETVVLNKNILEVKEGAFSNSLGIKQVIYFDSLQYVYDGSFSGSVSTIVLNAQRLPVYNTGEGAFAIKYARLRYLTAIGKKKLVVVSGSSTLNGMKSSYMESLLNNEYAVINYGTNAMNPSTFFLDVISNYATEDDIIIHAPEWNATGPLGRNEIVWKLFRASTQCFDIFREVDMSQYYNYWDAWRNFQVDEGKSAEKTSANGGYQVPNTGMNKYGDLTNENRKYRTPGMLGTLSFNSSHEKYVVDGATNLNKLNKKILSKGATLLASFATADMLSFDSGDSNWKLKVDGFTKTFADALDYPVISNMGTFVMEGSLMADSVWHCNWTGAMVRTYELWQDLNTYFNFVQDNPGSVGDTYKPFTERERYRATSYPKWESYP